MGYYWRPRISVGGDYTGLSLYKTLTHLHLVVHHIYKDNPKSQLTTSPSAPSPNSQQPLSHPPRSYPSYIPPSPLMTSIKTQEFQCGICRWHWLGIFSKTNSTSGRTGLENRAAIPRARSQNARGWSEVKQPKKNPGGRPGRAGGEGSGVWDESCWE